MLCLFKDKSAEKPAHLDELVSDMLRNKNYLDLFCAES